MKVLGILAMVDCGELDWKVIAIDTSDRLTTEYIPEHVVSGEAKFLFSAIAIFITFILQAFGSGSAGTRLPQENR